MPVFDTATQTKIAELRALRAAGEQIEVFELVKTDWPSPDGTIYYSVTQPNAAASIAPPVSPIVPRIVPSSNPAWFMPVSTDATIGDESIDLEMWDADGVISQLLVDHGEGVKVELFLWLPQVELLLSVWYGHLRFEDSAAVDTIKLKAAQGFRSADATLPHRAHWTFCQAVFGGLLDTQDEINQNDCPYNKHLGGSVGIDNPDTSAPWTFCDRTDHASCTARGVNPNFHLSHLEMASTILVGSNRGAAVYGAGIGNQTNLKEPVRVVMGRRRLYDMKVVNFLRQPGGANPAHGYFRAQYEACEGPIKSISQAVVTVGGNSQNASGAFYNSRLGYAGQTIMDATISTHSYSGTALIEWIFGWIDATNLGPDDASANALIEGLDDIYQPIDIEAGSGGLIAYWHRGDAFDDEVAIRLTPTVDITDSNTTAPGSVNSTDGFCIRLVGQIKPRYSETYTFTTPINDDIVRVTIDGDTIINDVTYPSTGSGTKALTADTLYDIEVLMTQTANPGYNPWGVQLKWQSTSQALEVVPATRLYHDAVHAYEHSYSTNRVWQILRMMTDKRWGYGLDIARFNLDSWRAAAEWSEAYVRFTDVNDNDWDHVRGESNVELVEKKVQQQIEDMCIAGRLSKPFIFDGQIHIVPLSALTEDELDACPVFTDEGGTGRNIIWENGKTTLSISRKSDIDLPNRIEGSFDDINADYKQTPAPPIEDVDQQLKAGRVVGDSSRKVNVKKYDYLGVIYKAQAMKLGWSLLDLGPCDEGGLQNNLTLKMKIWFMDALDLHPTKVVKVVNSRLTKYGFSYFRVMKIKRGGDLTCDLTLQAYNETYMAAFESDIAPLDPIDPIHIDPPPDPIHFGDLIYSDGRLIVPLEY